MKEYKAYLYEGDQVIDETSLDEFSIELAWELFTEFAKKENYTINKHMYITLEEQIVPST